VSDSFFPFIAPNSSFKSPTVEALSGREAVVFRALRVRLSVFTVLYVLVLMGDVPLKAVTKVALPQSRRMTELNPHKYEMWIHVQHDVSIRATSS
jgi:hypothetical protein